MNLSKFLACGAILATTFSYAQEFKSQTYVSDSGRLGYTLSKKAPSEPATGTQYYIEQFTPATVNGGREMSLVRYNAYSDEMEVKTEGEIMVMSPSDNMLVHLTNNRADYKFVQYTNKEGNAAQNYLIVISNNPNLTIYKKERIEFQPEQHPTGGYQRYKAPNYRKLEPHYFIQINNGPVVYMSDKKKDVYELVTGKEKEIKDFIKDNKIDTSDDADMQQLGNYLSSIL